MSGSTISKDKVQVVASDEAGREFDRWLAHQVLQDRATRVVETVGRTHRDDR